MNHVALLGDSILDNRAYVAPEPDVAEQLRARLGKGWRVSLVAVDGHVTADVERRQIDRIPADATHLVLSVGGNDALGHASVLRACAGTVADAVDLLADAQASFAASYVRMIDAVVKRNLPTAVCTIYDADHPEPQHRLVVAALALFNDVITRAAFVRGLPVVDLRLICTDSADYANPIEPSAAGGEKIAAVIAELVRHVPNGRSTIWC
jgi:lysophospholipase L1-like esterase